MVATDLLRTFQGTFTTLEELRIGRAFVLLELTNDDQLVAGEVILRQVQSDGLAVEVAAFVVYSTNIEALPPGDIVERRMSLGKVENARWTLALIHYY